MIKSEMIARLWRVIEDHPGSFLKYCVEEKSYIVQKGLLINGDEWIVIAVHVDDDWILSWQADELPEWKEGDEDGS